MKQIIFGMLGRLFWERPGAQRNFTDHVARLESTAGEIATRAQHAEPNDRNREALAHLIGIERWGQRRLRVGFGESFVAEEYDGYRPVLATPWEEMVEQFQTTRAETVALAQRYANNEGNVENPIDHNDYGGLTPHGWLEYLRVHAALTAKLIR